MKSIFFTGKGGVGKSTLAATAAWQLAQRGLNVLAVSFDPAHNLGDIYGRRLSHKKLKFTDRLFLQEIDLDTAAAAYIEKNIDILTQIYSYTRAFNFDLYFKVLKHSPGVEEYAALTAMETIFREETAFDYVVFDTPPTGLTLRILALPNITITWVDRLKRIRKEILKKRHTIHSLTGKYNEAGYTLPYDENEDGVMQTLTELWNRYLNVYKQLKGPDTSVAAVFNPDYLSLRETERIISGLNDLQIKLGVLFDNKYEDRRQDVASEVEKALLDKLPKKRRVEVVRVPQQDTTLRDEAYTMDFDIASTFIGEPQPV